MRTFMFQLKVMLMAAILSVGSLSCGSDDDNEDNLGGTTSSKAKVSLSMSRSGTSSYTATVTVSGVDASDVIVLGVRAEPQSSSGYKPAKYVEAGSRSTKGTCSFTLEKGITYYVYGYANINGTRVESAKQTIRTR